MPEEPAKIKVACAILLAVVLPTVLAGCALSKSDQSHAVYTQWPFDAAEAKRRQTETAERLGVPVEKVIDLGGGVKLEMVLIPAGEFIMGSEQSPEDLVKKVDENPMSLKATSADFKPEQPQHRVRITRPFWLGKYEVTQEQWEKVMRATPSKFKGARNPVEMVNWDDCQEFLKKLKALEKEQSHFRLPTEAEWEWACRAGTRTRFCSGDDEGTLGEYAWYDANSGGTLHRVGTKKPNGEYAWCDVISGGTTHPVGEKKPNGWGLYDCHGNVWEWCGDWLDECSHRWAPKVDPTGPVTGDYHVLRGGGWHNAARFCRSAYRDGNLPDCRYAGIGFRVVMVPVGH
jgi:formylglycine-generating enzyme required for sulfatase activity